VNLSGAVRLWWAAWSGRRHPALLLFVTALAAFVAMILMLGAIDTPIVLYKEF
jgi:hypothetical protein